MLLHSRLVLTDALLHSLLHPDFFFDSPNPLPSRPLKTGRTLPALDSAYRLMTASERPQVTQLHKERANMDIQCLLQVGRYMVPPFPAANIENSCIKFTADRSPTRSIAARYKFKPGLRLPQSTMSIPNLYNFGLAASAIQCIFGWWAFALTPPATGSSIKLDDDDGEAPPMTYRRFLAGGSSLAVLSLVAWVLLIALSRSKKLDSRRVSAHFGCTLTGSVYKFLLVCLVLRAKRSEAFSEFLSTCGRTGFRSLACTPLGTLLLGPIVEILIFLVAAFTIRRRAIAKYGVQQVEVPAPPRELVAAWTMAHGTEALDELPVSDAKRTYLLGGVSTVYVIGLLLTIMQGLFGWSATALTESEPTGNKSNDMTYYLFSVIMSSLAAVSTVFWIVLICGRKMRADGIFYLTWSYGLERMYMLGLLLLEPRSKRFSELVSSCSRAGFMSFGCAPLGVLLFCPILEILLLLLAAFLIRRRAIAIHGFKQVEDPSPHIPYSTAAWMRGDVLELDDSEVSLGKEVEMV
ncbi:hypothetical protein B0H16DRAFT_1546824 [Mycena metata]|uniref:Transmembrane protein n=1 Tax=Mycena metata TaxID=1033252 RepID=A0AAD7IX55_9AGAR|nr:hypothetical protein B0H16DRAFT_1546824 [Mycena metata]